MSMSNYAKGVGGNSSRLGSKSLFLLFPCYWVWILEPFGMTTPRRLEIAGTFLSHKTRGEGL